ncbi:hypothetical protein EV183_002343 [Coemansia sp. RSA 2336]|nr:hypothetical protein EV183_002343 [Coemansia sp. RSA 2336]
MRLSLAIVSFTLGVLGNTEIRHFRPHVHKHARCLEALSPVVLTSPHTLTEITNISTLESSAAQTAKEHWYCLENLEPHLYELRVSYAATDPSSFNIEIFTEAELKKLVDVDGDLPIALHAKISASYAGVSNIPGLEEKPVPYILALERHVWGVPIQALLLIAVLVAVVAFSLAVVTPRIIAQIDLVLSENKDSKID